MARTLKEILEDLNNAEKEYTEKCKKYGIEEKHRKKKVEVQLDENGNPIEQQTNEVDDSVEQANNGEETTNIVNQEANENEKGD